MFKLFKKLHHTRNLIYTNHEGNIIFSEYFPEGILELAKDIILYNNLYDGKVYKAIYKEYKKHYTVYDLSPWLLYFRIPLVISAQYVHRDLIEPNSYLKSVTFINKYIPKQFRIPQPTKDIIIECLRRSLPYMAKSDMSDVYDFEKYLEFKFLSEWPTYIKNPDKYITVFSNVMFRKFIQAGGDNYRTVSNVIERTIQSKMQEAASN